MFRIATKSLIIVLDWAKHLHQGDRAITFYARHIAAVERLQGAARVE